MLLVQGPYFKNHCRIPVILVQNKTKAASEVEFEQTETIIWLKLMREEEEQMLLEIVSLGDQDKNNYAIKSVAAYSALDSVLALSVLYIGLNSHYKSISSVSTISSFI